MKNGIYAPIFNDYCDPNRLITLAQEAEKSGFDGFFIWDHLAIEPDGQLHLADAMTVLAAIAAVTKQIAIGPMITPLARRRPWKVAKELTTLDHLSAGRTVFGIGLGEPAEVEFGRFDEPSSPKERASRLDEGMALVDQFLRGEPVSHRGKHYHVDNVTLMPTSLQQPRIPIWVAASLPAHAGLKRAARWDGCFPIKVPGQIVEGVVANAAWPEWWLDPAELRQACEIIKKERGHLDDFAVAATGSTINDNPSDAKNKINAYEQAGANWWLEWIDDEPGSYDAALALVQRGPVK